MQYVTDDGANHRYGGRNADRERDKTDGRDADREASGGNKGNDQASG